MSRAREPKDWEHDLAAARPTESLARNALTSHPSISHFSDFTAEMDVLDFRFRFEGSDVQLDVKAKLSRISQEIADQWPEVPRDELFILDETCFRELVWNEGLGYLLVFDGPREKWHVFGPWELCLGPRRRFERRGNRTGVDFLKGKHLLDFRTASQTTNDLDIDALLGVVRTSRAALRNVRALPIRSEGLLPVLPSQASRDPAAPSQPEISKHDDSLNQMEPDAEPLDPAWCGLSNSLVAAIKQQWGWQTPTPAQQATFPAILENRNVLLLAPTAGGKTEAALLPLLDLYQRHGWKSQSPSILSISPLKALLDDQLVRWQRLTSLVGATAFAWHSDVSSEEKRAFTARPADALLTTPESLELLLTSPTHDERSLFSGLKAVVIDEVHAFVGTTRGGQLASLLERLFAFAETDFQRIGLSATVGNPQGVLDWVRGASMRESQLINVEPRMKGEDVSVKSYLDVDELISHIKASAAGHRTIVFTKSRRRAEQLGLGLKVPVHHSSVSPEDRDGAIEKLRSGDVDCIVATSSLEMGIDIGDLDLVIHDGAPSSPGSYLQRLGRAGRKSGQRRIVFTIGEQDDLLLLHGILARVRRRELESVNPQRGARLILGQQSIASTLQSFIADRWALRETLQWSPTFAGLETDIDATIDHLLANRWLQGDGDRLVLGPEGQRKFGGTNGINQLLVTFSSHAGVTVVDSAGRRVGTIDLQQIDEREGSRSIAEFVLSGRTWTVVEVNRDEGIVTVQPGGKGKPPSWRGSMVEVDRTTWESVRDILTRTDVPIELDARAEAMLHAARSSWVERIERPVQSDGKTTVVHSFCGVEVHRTAIAALNVDGAAEGASCEFHASLPQLTGLARELLDDFEQVLDVAARTAASKIAVRFPELIPPSVLEAEARRFHVDSEGLYKVLTMLASS